MSPEVVLEQAPFKEVEAVPLLQGVSQTPEQAHMASDLIISRGKSGVKRSKDNDRILAELNNAYSQRLEVQDAVGRFRTEPEYRRCRHHTMDDTDPYIETMDSYRLLEPLEERRQLVAVTRGLDAYRKIAKQGRNSPNIDEEKILMDAAAAREILYVCNLRLAFDLATGYFGRSRSRFSEMDYVQEATQGLGLAIARYDIKHKERFSTYATNWIRNQLARSFKDKSKIIRIPEHKYAELGSITNAVDDLSPGLGKEPTPQEIAQFTDMDVDEVRILMQANACNSSLDERAWDRRNTEQGDLVSDPDASTEIDRLLDEISDQSDAERAVDATDLDELELIVLGLCRGVRTVKINKALSSVALKDITPGKATYTQAAPIIGGTRDRVSQIDRGAIAKMQEMVGV